MRHLKAGRKLNRNASHRDALMRNLARALILHGRIITTVEKAKELRPFVEKLITLAKQGTLHARRLAIARLHDKEMVRRLFSELGERYQDRAGGYTRVIKRPERRLGDGGKTAFIELLKPGEHKTPKKAAPAPAPRIAPPTPAEPPPSPPAPAATEQPATPPPAAPEAAQTRPAPPNPPAGQ
jgi:large subunit ribosomal protein L17